MEDMVLEEKPSILSKIAGMFARTEEVEAEEAYTAPSESPVIRPNYRYTVTIRREFENFEDALAVANGLKRGEQQVINLTLATPENKRKIVDFLSGVSYAQDGIWEEVGPDVYLIAPVNAFVEVAPATPRMNALKN